jgi:hypothetical protein
LKQSESIGNGIAFENTERINLEVYGVHDKGDMEYDKNYISAELMC